VLHDYHKSKREGGAGPLSSRKGERREQLKWTIEWGRKRKNFLIHYPRNRKEARKGTLFSSYNARRGGDGSHKAGPPRKEKRRISLLPVRGKKKEGSFLTRRSRRSLIPKNDLGGGKKGVYLSRRGKGKHRNTVCRALGASSALNRGRRSGRHIPILLQGRKGKR